MIEQMIEQGLGKPTDKKRKAIAIITSAFLVVFLLSIPLFLWMGNWILAANGVVGSLFMAHTLLQIKRWYFANEGWSVKE